MIREFDFLVIGSGIAGMSFALKVAHKGKVALICKTELEEANTFFAQGGIASVTNTLVDNFDKHIEDTMIAGDWISDRAAVEKVVREAPGQIKELIEWGVEFDKNDKGDFDLHKEGGHSEFRILHHKDNTGAEIQESLIKAVKTHPNIEIFNRHFAVEIITQHHMGIIVPRHTPGIKCYGAYVLNEDTGEVDTFLSKVTLMATGGVGAVYRNTTNPLVATGDGIAMVYRAKGFVQDMEFIQFHPTALYHPGDRPCFLITEAMRGYGAVLRNMGGEEFMQKFAPQYNTVEQFVSKKIGIFTEDISTRPAFFGPSAFVDFIHSLQLDISGADISLVAPLSFDAEIKKGDIHVSDMFNLYKYENMLYVMTLSGKEIKDILEDSYYMWTNQMKSPQDHLLWFKEKRREGAEDRASFQNFSFNFDSAAGIIYTVDVTKPKGAKITVVSMADGAPFDLNKVYKVALNSYRGNGGGELLTKGAGIPQEQLKDRIIFSTDKDLRFYLMNYIEKKGILDPRALNQWKFIPEDWTGPAAKRDYKYLFSD